MHIVNINISSISNNTVYIIIIFKDNDSNEHMKFSALKLCNLENVSVLKLYNLESSMALKASNLESCRDLKASNLATGTI